MAWSILIRSAGRVAVAVLGAAFALSAAAQDYPGKPVRIIVPFAPGGSADVYGRFIALLAGPESQALRVDSGFEI